MKKKKRVEVLTKASQDAVSAVRKMIQSLKNTNEQVSEEIIINDNMIIQIQQDNKSLNMLKEDNERIVSKFEALLS